MRVCFSSDVTTVVIRPKSGETRNILLQQYESNQRSLTEGDLSELRVTSDHPITLKAGTKYSKVFTNLVEF